MRKKIKQLAYGTFDYNEPEISFSTERIELDVLEGKDVTGEFTIHGSNGKKLRGMAYSTHSRMECLTPQFEGEEIRIRYQFHSQGLVEGDVRKGEFVIVCNQGEYNLSFVVCITKAYAKTSVGIIKNMSDFVRLARENMEEAYQVFYSVSFPYILKDADEKERLLYEAFRKESPSMQAVENYLSGIGRKPFVNVYLEETNAAFAGVLEDRKEQLTLKKEHWGYVGCEVKADADFIRLSKDSISSEDFLGSTCLYEYYIDVNALHAGKNYGHIVFEFPEKKLIFDVCATSTEAGVVNAEVVKHRQYLKYRADLTRYYIEYRTKKIVTGVWAKNSIDVLNHLLEAEPENELYLLMKAQAFLVNKQKQEASWILETYKRSSIDKNTPEWGYYLYLCTLMEREESYVNHLADQIEELFKRNSDSSLLYWVLLFMREDYYKNPARRLKAIEQWVEKGCDSPFFYLEAFYLYWQDPYLLTRLDKFEIKVLNWARKQGVISKEVALQILALMPTIRHYDEKILYILESCYGIADKEAVISAICSYLIKGQKFSAKYHNWYVLGVEKEVHITNLYEAYLLSADKESIKQAPKAIFMYFQYHNTLPYKQLALLYAFIIQNKDKYKKIYQNYRRTMEQFAMSQLEAGHMDENLAIIYKEMLPCEMLTRKLAEQLAEVLFVHGLKVTKEKQFARAIIVQKQMKHRQVVQVIDGTAYFEAFSEDYCILLQDNKGRFFSEERFYEEKALLEVESYLDMAMQLAPIEIPYLVHYFNKKQKSHYFAEGDKERFSVLMDASEIREEWKALLQPIFVNYFASKDFGSHVERCLKEADYDMLKADSRHFMIEQLIEHQMFELAYELLQRYGYDMIGSSYRLSLCSYQITYMQYEEDDFLVEFASDTFGAGKYNNVILEYLCRYYKGPTRKMALIWKAAAEMEADTYDLEERIITQMLYSAELVEQIDEIYEAYCKKGGKELVYLAYLSYFSHLYLVKDAVVSEQIFLQIEHRILTKQEVMDVQSYALLKYYSEIGKLTEGQYKIADKLLLEALCQGRYFAFYKKMEKRLITKYHLQDKDFIEYHTQPGTTVFISYYVNDESLREEEMTEMYEGIFVKEMVLFWGDKLSYYLSESDATDRQVIESGQIEKTDAELGNEHGRYALINKMLKNVALQKTEDLECLMKEYSKKKYATENLFKLL